MTYPTPPVPNYQDQVGPVLTAAEMNWIDQQCRSPGTGLSNPVTIATGGTNATNAAAALANLGGTTLAAATTSILAQIYPPTQAEILAGQPIVSNTYPGPGQADVVHMFRYLTQAQIADVLAYTFGQDLTTPIQSAINMLNNWSVYSNALGQKDTPGADYGRGGILYAPGGGYLISQPILGAPNIILRGAVPLRSSVVGSSGYNASSGALITVIKAAASFPAQQYMIDSGTWRRYQENGTPVGAPYRVVSAVDQFISSASGGVDTNAFIVGFQIENLALDGNSVAFGGRRQQLGAFFRDDGIAVYNTLFTGLAYTQCFEFGLGASTVSAPIPLFCSANESMEGDKAEWQHYSVASSAWTAGNQALIDSVFYANNGGAEPGNWGGLTLKCGLFQWCTNTTVGYYAPNAGNVGIEAYRSNINILHCENEFTADGAHPGAVFLVRDGSTVVVDGFSTKATCALASGDTNGKLIIRQPFFIGCPTSFTPLTNETSSAFLIELHNMPIVDQVLGTQMRVSNVNLSRVFNPQVNGVNYTGALTLYCDSAVGSATLDGFLAAHPTTIDGALQFIANNPQIPEWAIYLKGTQTHTIAAAHTINREKLLFTWDGAGSTPALSATIAALLRECDVVFIGIVASGWTTNGLFKVSGRLTINIGGYSGGGASSVSIPAGKTLFSAADLESCIVTMNGSYPVITFGAGAGLANGGTDGLVLYQDSLVQQTVNGAAALEAITTGRVKKIISSIV